MRKIYSLVLMAAALLIGTNAWADATVSTWDDLKTALQAGGEVTLGANIEYDAPVYSSSKNYWDGIWIGTTTEGATGAPNAILNMNGKTITIRSTKNAQVLNPFIVSKGSLKVIGTGKIEVIKDAYTVGEGTNVFSVFGASTASASYNPKGENPFTLLEIGKDVTVETANGTVVLVDKLTTSHNSINYLAAGDKPTYATNGYAFGARVDVMGTLRSVEGTKCYGVKTNGNLLAPQEADKQYAPYVHIHSTGVLESNQTTNTGSAAAYPSGYAQWLIEGTCNGASGVYVSAGKVEINNATIKSGAATYTQATSNGHAESSGSAIVINSRPGYQGSMDVTVSGDTKVEATSGYALEEVVNKSESGVASIAIEGGTFDGGEEGALAISEKTATDVEAQVTVAGGNVQGAANIGNDELAEYLAGKGGTHATMVEDENGNTVLVITKGDAPDEMNLADAKTAYETWVEAGKPAADSVSVKITGAIAEADGKLNANYEFKELELNAAEAQILTVVAGNTLKVGRVVLGVNAQIIVQPGAKFIVYGSQGIVAPVASNIVLKASESAQALFLFNPAVTSNRHPNATVQMTSKNIGHVGSSYYWHRFALPIEEIAAAADFSREPADATHATYIYTWDYVNDEWASISAITDMKAFRGYTLTTVHDGKDDMLYTFKGQLAGNVDKKLEFENAGYNFFGNSYTGSMSVDQIASDLLSNGKMEGTVWIWNAVNQRYDALPLNTLGDLLDDEKQISSTHTFILRKAQIGAMDDVNLDYESAVWSNPIYVSITGASAPRRRAANNNNSASMRIMITAANGQADMVRFVENSERSDEFDNGYDASKFMNTNTINAYATINGENLGAVATDNLEGKMFNFTTNSEIAYTLSFERVNGEDYAIKDNETGAIITISEDNTYEFAAQPNSVVEGRFEIVGRAMMPTAIENTEVKANVKGIYTIMGQYLGEDFDILPAGVYVVNGVKIVK